AVRGGVTRQAVDERRRRRTVVALRPADGSWVYPAFQLDDRNRVLRGRPAVLARFHPRTPEDEWMVAQFLVSRQPGLGGRSIVDHLRAGGDLQPVPDLTADRAARWALAS